jgi:hypothetical protein
MKTVIKINIRPAGQKRLIFRDGRTRPVAFQQGQIVTEDDF